MSQVFDIALVFSAHEWVESLHRHCTNTGTLRIRSLVYDSAVLSSETFDACVISDTHPTLSASLVNKLHKDNKLIFGVCDQSNDSLEFLASIGVDAVFSSRDSAEKLTTDIIQFLDQHIIVQSTPCANDQQYLSTLDSFEQPDKRFKINDARKNKIAVVGCGGTGATEISIALSSRLVDCVLVDFDFESPSVGPRAGLQVDPNLLSAIEESSTKAQEYALSVQRMPKNAAIVGVAHSSFAKDIKTYEVASLLESVESQYSNGVFDLGTISQNSTFWNLQQQILISSNSIVVVGEPTPVGILRVLETIASINSILLTLDSPLKVVVIINKVWKNLAQQNDILSELQTIPQISSIHFLGFSKDMYANSWKSETRCPKGWNSKIENIVFEIESNEIDLTEIKDANDSSKAQEPRTKVSA